MNVKLIRFTTGEDVVANLTVDLDDVIAIEDAIVAIPNGQGNIGFAPWSPILSKTEKELSVPRKFVMYIANPADEVVEYYNKMFGTIITPESKLII
jgi:hypothetical protein